MKRIVLIKSFIKLVHHKICISSIVVGMEKEVSQMRIDYKVNHIEDEKLPSKNPYTWFSLWFEEAVKHPNIVEANTMNIATCSKNGSPSSRMVLLKGFSENGFRFYTNHQSHKGKELAENPRAALTFYWEPLQMQIRINGDVERLSEEVSTQYFHSRPVASQIGALVSNQSTVIPSLKYLEEKRIELTNLYNDKDIPKPEYWGGYLVKAISFEFWCGGTGRLHSRIRFRRPLSDEKIDEIYTKTADDGWVYEVLSP